jgi:hypothetical protein
MRTLTALEDSVYAVVDHLEFTPYTYVMSVGKIVHVNVTQEQVGEYFDYPLYEYSMRIQPSVPACAQRALSNRLHFVFMNTCVVTAAINAEYYFKGSVYCMLCLMQDKTSEGHSQTDRLLIIPDKL